MLDRFPHGFVLTVPFRTPDFDELSWAEGFTEGSAWQYRFYLPFAVPLHARSLEWVVVAVTCPLRYRCTPEAKSGLLLLLPALCGTVARQKLRVGCCCCYLPFAVPRQKLRVGCCCCYLPSWTIVARQKLRVSGCCTAQHGNANQYK